MKETESPESTTPWKLPAVAASLHAGLSTCDDVVRGRGYRLTFPEGVGTPPALLELYPERLIARYRSPLVELDVARVRRVEPLVDMIRIDAGDARAQTTVDLEAGGALTLVVTPVEPKGSATSPHENVPTAAEPAVLAVKETGLSARESDQLRVNLVGRVGAPPIFRTTPKGVVVGKFPLAVREGENKTRWHTVLAFGPRAVKLEDAVKKGDAVEVIGYKHLREFTKRDGSQKTVEEIYAVIVKSR